MPTQAERRPAAQRSSTSAGSTCSEPDDANATTTDRDRRVSRSCRAPTTIASALAITLAWLIAHRRLDDGDDRERVVRHTCRICGRCPLMQHRQTRGAQPHALRSRAMSTWVPANTPTRSPGPTFQRGQTTRRPSDQPMHITPAGSNPANQAHRRIRWVQADGPYDDDERSLERRAEIAPSSEALATIRVRRRSATVRVRYGRKSRVS